MAAALIQQKTGRGRSRNESLSIVLLYAVGWNIWRTAIGTRSLIGVTKQDLGSTIARRAGAIPDINFRNFSPMNSIFRMHIRDWRFYSFSTLFAALKCSLSPGLFRRLSQETSRTEIRTQCDSLQSLYGALNRNRLTDTLCAACCREN